MTKNSYARFEDVRAYQDKQTGDIHLTIKDSRLDNGFKLTLNSGRKEELALRAILDAEDKSTPLPAVSTLPAKASYEYHLPSLASGPMEGEFEGYSYKTVSSSLIKMASGNYIPLGITGEGRFDNFFWNLMSEPHMLVAANKKFGLTTFLRSIVYFVSERHEKFNYFIIDAGKKNVVSDPSKNFTTLEGAIKLLKGVIAASSYPGFFQDNSGLYNVEPGNFTTRTIIMINELEKLRPENPTSWREIILYEELLDMVKRLEWHGATIGMHLIQSSENFDTDELTQKDFKYYSRRVILGSVPARVSELVIKEGSDDGVRIPKIPGRGLTCAVRTSRDDVVVFYNNEYIKEFQAYQLNTNNRA